MGKPYNSSIVPGRRAVQVVPGDADLPKYADEYPRFFLIGTAGNVSLTFDNGEEANDMPAQSGIFRFSAKKLRVTNNSPASNIWACW